MSILNNLNEIQRRITAACDRCGRNPSEVTLVAVSKTMSVVRIEEAMDAGITTFGENRIQEAWQKYQAISQRVHWHFIGHLQTNKAKRAVQFADVIEAVDSYHLAAEIDKRARELDRRVEIYVQVNTSGEYQKSGVSPEEAVAFVDQISCFKNLDVTGLMTIGAFLPDPEQVRPNFTRLRQLRDMINDSDRVQKLSHLSMGMTDDFEVAIEEGATVIRIGRALFGERV